MSRRSEELKAAVESYFEVHNAWVADPNREYPDETYWDAVDQMRAVFSHGDIPDESRHLAEAVGLFFKQVDAYDNRDDVNDLSPPNEFWMAREAVERMMIPAAPPELRPLESIPVLVAQGVPHRQIATIYGFRDRYGELIIGLVQKEIDQPGSVLNDPGGIDGRPWVDPRLAEREAAARASEEATAAAERRKRSAEKSGQDQADKAAGKGRSSEAIPAGPPCHETPEELWQQGVSPKQAAKMLRKSETEVVEMFAGFEKAADDAMLEGDDGGQESATLADKPGAAGDAITQAIRELHASGKKPGEIVRELRVDPKKVKEALAGRPSAA